MPGRDGSGPLGKGSMTGRGMGICKNGAGRNKMGAGLGCGFGAGRGRRNQNMTAGTSLEDQKATLEAQLEDVNKRMGN